MGYLWLQPQIVLVSILLIVLACEGPGTGGGAGSGGTLSRGNCVVPPPPSEQEALSQILKELPFNIDDLAKALAESGLARESLQDLKANVLKVLSDGDAILSSSITPVSRYTTVITELLQQDSINTMMLTVIVDDDFKKESITAGGGSTSHNIIILDGKFLDILMDYNNFLSKSHDILGNDLVNSIDRIVIDHNRIKGSMQLIYQSSTLSQEERDESLNGFMNSIAILLYHEFGHIYFYHAYNNVELFLNTSEQVLVDLVKGCIERRKSDGTFEFTATNENSADLLAGMLLRKAGLNLNVAMQTIDLLDFYAKNRAGSVTSLTQITDSEPAQFTPNDARYSSLAVRKQLITEGYHRYAQANGIP